MMGNGIFNSTIHNKQSSEINYLENGCCTHLRKLLASEKKIQHAADRKPTEIFDRMKMPMAFSYWIKHQPWHFETSIKMSMLVSKFQH